MRIVVDSYPKNSCDCLFAYLVGHNSDGPIYRCKLLEYDSEYDPDDRGYKIMRTCEGVAKCKHLVTN